MNAIVSLSSRNFRNNRALPFLFRSSLFSTTEKVSFDSQDAQQYYDQLLKKASVKTNKIARGDLKNLILKCDEKEKLQIALDGVELYQNRAMDFSEEICTHFVGKFLKFDEPVTAAKVLTKKGHRLGSYLNRNTTVTMTEALSAAGEVELIIELVQSLISRGVLQQQQIVAENLLKGASAKGDATLYDRASELCGKIIAESELASLTQKYPAPQSIAEVSDEAAKDV